MMMSLSQSAKTVTAGFLCFIDFYYPIGIQAIGNFLLNLRGFKKIILRRSNENNLKHYPG